MVKNNEVKFMFKQAKIEKLVPPSCLDSLPFKKESINSWNPPKVDILLFLRELFNIDSEMLGTDGKKIKVNHAQYGDHVFDEGYEHFENLCEDFRTIARKNKPAPGSCIKKIKQISFLDDEGFGLVAKYYTAYDAIISQMLQESQFFSIPHILESVAELDCSILLAQNLYYKQSLQVLRNFIEILISQIIFCNNHKAFSDWREGRYKLPSLRGKKGILNELKDKEIIPPELTEEIAESYGKLNSYIHSSEGNLIHRGLFKGQWKGFIFDSNYFEIWCVYFSKIVDLGIRLLDLHHGQYMGGLPKGGCNICHNSNFKLIKETEFGGQSFLELECEKCQNRITLPKNLQDNKYFTTTIQLN